MLFRSCETETGAIGALSQKLHLFNGDLVNARIAAEGSRLHQMLLAGNEPMEIVDAFYLAAFNRRLSTEEQQHWETQLAKSKSPDEQRAFLEDFVWGLVTCEEFVTNH